MKKLFLVLAAGIVIASCKEADNKTAEPNKTPDVNAISNAANKPGPSTSQPPTDSTKQTTIEWAEGTNIDFGTMKQGDTLNVVFPFKNIGNKPLIISNVSAGCGCTIPEIPKKPYAPGETGVIRATFDSNKGQVGHNSKQVTVFSNTNPEAMTLVFSVDVKAKN
jgi:hypothetical protein